MEEIYNQENNFGRWRRNEFFMNVENNNTFGIIFILLIIYYIIQFIYHLIITTK